MAIRFFYIFFLALIGSSSTCQSSNILECNYKNVMVGEVEICLPEIMDYDFYYPDSVFGKLEQPTVTILGYYLTEDNNWGKDIFNQFKVYVGNVLIDEYVNEDDFKFFKKRIDELREEPLYDIREKLVLPDSMELDKPIIIDTRTVSDYYFYFVLLYRSSIEDGATVASITNTIHLKGKVINISHKVKYESLDKLKEQLSLDEYIVRRIHEINL